MLITFYGQLIFDSKLNPVGIEILARGDKGHGHLSPIVSPSDIFNLPEFQLQHYYALDMQVISQIAMVANQLKGFSPVRYVFVNLSDVLLKELVSGSDDSLPFASIVSLGIKLAPIKLVVEVNERSSIRPEHLVLIVERLKDKGVFLAQDDFDESRLPYLSSPWDFVKLNIDQLTPSLINKHLSNGAPLIIERAQKKDVSPLSTHLYQGFELHEPECLFSLIKGLVKDRNSQKKQFCHE
ncbi:MAG: EAL domain-containing protein [Methyloprofundus sp.]|nr:EAL domain-containing protein [Methyloprofundus sp.]